MNTQNMTKKTNAKGLAPNITSQKLCSFVGSANKRTTPTNKEKNARIYFNAFISYQTQCYKLILISLMKHAHTWPLFLRSRDQAITLWLRYSPHGSSRPWRKYGAKHVDGNIFSAQYATTANVPFSEFGTLPFAPRFVFS